MAKAKTAAKSRRSLVGKILGVGEKIIVRTVTHYFTGRVVDVTPEWIALGDAAWIADSARWHEALCSGKLNEVEPYPGPCLVARGSVVDVSPWCSDLPRLVI